MFARLLWRLLRGNSGRLTVAMIAIISGAAVISALLDLQLDIERKLTQEFRALGPNVIVSIKVAAGASGDQRVLASAPDLADQAAVQQAIDATIGAAKSPEVVGSAPYLYLVARIQGTPVVIAGTNLSEAIVLDPSWKVEPDLVPSPTATDCIVGRNVADTLKLVPGSKIQAAYLGHEMDLTVRSILNSGSAQDNQILANLDAVQKLARTPGKIEVEQLRIGGSSANVLAYSARLSALLPGYSVEPIRQVTEAEGNLLHRTRLLIASTIALILILTALCILATMAALTMERRNDVGLMKALGGSIGRIMTLFFAELGVMGAAGGAVGCLLGYILARWTGERVFDTMVSPRWQVFPLTVATMMLIALAGALPLRRLGRVKPAEILRGE